MSYVINKVNYDDLIGVATVMMGDSALQSCLGGCRSLWTPRALDLARLRRKAGPETLENRLCTAADRHDLEVPPTVEGESNPAMTITFAGQWAFAAYLSGPSFDRLQSDGRVRVSGDQSSEATFGQYFDEAPSAARILVTPHSPR